MALTSLIMSTVPDLNFLFVLQLLLILSGDVEVNPGPLTQEDKEILSKVDASTFGEDDWNIIVIECNSLAYKWKELSAFLGLRKNVIEGIKKNHPCDVAGCLNDALGQWIKQKYNTRKFGMPSWRKLLEAIALIDNRIFKKLACEHEGTTAPPSIGQKLSASLPASPRDQTSPTLSQNYKRWHKLLADIYLIDDSLTHSWPPLRASQFVRLSLVRQDYGESRHLDLKTVYGKIDEVYGDKTSIDIKDIFNVVVSKSIILFEGRPGSGKTTLMIRISREWANGELFQSKLVFLVQLRRLGGKKDVDLCDLIRVACGTLTSEDIRDLKAYIEGMKGEGVVFILDGFDEYASGANEDNFIYKLIAKRVFPESIVIVSSRPAATQPFRMVAEKWIEVVGFMEKEVIEYIHSFFKDDQKNAEMMIEYLKQHPNLMNICYLPLHCAMLVYLDEFELPKTESEFYRKFILSTFVRHSCKTSGSIPLRISSFDRLSPQERELLQMICQLAFTATIDSRQTFEYSELRDIFEFEVKRDEISGPGVVDIDKSDEIGAPGVVVTDKYLVDLGYDKRYTFLHLTLQEYLAAVYISRLSATEQEAIIKEHGKKQNLFVTWRFLFGTLDYSKGTAANLMMKDIREIDDSCNFLIQCAYESQNYLVCSHVIVSYQNKLRFSSELSLSSTDVACIIHLLKCSKCSDIHLSFKDCVVSVDDATALLQGIGDCQLSLTLEGYDQKQVSLVDSLNVVPSPSLVRLELCCIRSVEEFPNPKNFTDLQVLKLDKVNEIDGLEESVQCWPKLKELYLHGYDCDVSHAEAIIRGLKHCPQLERFIFCGDDEPSCLDKSACGTLGETLQYLPELQHINLTGIRDIGDLGVAHLSKGIARCARLKELNLGGCGISDSGVAHLAKGITHCVHLEKLTLCGNENICIGDSGVRHLSKSIARCAHLKELDLDSCGISDSGAAHLAEGITHCAHLENLELKRNENIGDSGVGHLSKSIARCAHLKELNLGWCGISDSGMAHLAEGITHCAHLERLTLSRNYISDAEVKALLKSLLMNCEDIRELDLDGNILTNESIPCLVDFIKSSRNLEKLELVGRMYVWLGNKFTERGWSKLVKAVKQRNSTEDMSQLKLVGGPTVKPGEESGESEDGTETDDSEDGTEPDDSEDGTEPGESEDGSEPSESEEESDESDTSQYFDGFTAVLDQDHRASSEEAPLRATPSERTAAKSQQATAQSQTSGSCHVTDSTRRTATSS